MNLTERLRTIRDEIGYALERAQNLEEANRRDRDFIADMDSDVRKMEAKLAPLEEALRHFDQWNRAWQQTPEGGWLWTDPQNTGRPPYDLAIEALATMEE